MKYCIIFFFKIDETTIINNKKEIQNRINSLKEDENSDFYKSLTRNTDSSVSVAYRFDAIDELVKEIINEVGND